MELFNEKSSRPGSKAQIRYETNKPRRLLDLGSMKEVTSFRRRH
jgi:hypothetical protein